jgi:uncharacterized repeat protein (TIGR02543 family)
MKSQIKMKTFIGILISSVLLAVSCSIGTPPQENPNDPEASNYTGSNPTFSVIYDGNGSTSGSVPADSTKYTQGNTVTVSGNTGILAKPGYAFSGWNTLADGNGTNYAQGQTFSIGSANINLYAKWSANPVYSVTYNGNGYISGSVPIDSTNYETGQVITVPGNPEGLVKSAFTFAGWNTQADGNGTNYTQGQTFSMGSANVVLYAKWTANPTYSVIYNGNGNTSGSVPADSTNYESGTMITVIGNPGNLLKTGYAFIGWNTQVDGNGTTYAQGQTFAMGSANVSLFAKWTLNPTYTLTYNGNGNTGGIVPIDNTNYENGQLVSVPGNPGNLLKTGYAFRGWNTQMDGSGTNYVQGQTFPMGSANAILYAKWTTFTVSYNANGATEGTVPVDSNFYAQGANVTVLGNTGSLLKTGFYFISWNTQTDGSGMHYAPGQTFAMGTADVTLYARWSTIYTVGSINFTMVNVPGKSFKTGTDDSGAATVTAGYYVGETEVTYELWSAVYTWAGANGYIFANPGVMGDGTSDTIQHPVTTINWRDAIVWTNALTGYYNSMNGTSYTYVYKAGGLPIKDSTDANAGTCDNVVPDNTATGFRIPTRFEWELAARYKGDLNNDGDISDAGEYYPGNYASGGTADYNNASATGAVSWYSANSGTSTHAVKGKTPNALGLYDMSGNVREWCFDVSPTSPPLRIINGGSWSEIAGYSMVGNWNHGGPPAQVTNIGFRLAKNQ